MSNLQRSQSTPHVAPQQPFLIPSASPKAHLHASARPRIRRHQTSLALTDLVSRSSSHSGHHTPRTEDDPFNLGGFFPSALAAGTPERSEAEWNWLHADEDTVAEDRINEEEADDGRSSPHVMFDRAEDARTAEMILQEDKLGVLSLRCEFPVFPDLSRLNACPPCDGDRKRNVFRLIGLFSDPDNVVLFIADILSTSSSKSQQTTAYDRLLSPYCDDNPLDDDAVYQSFAALRDAHAVIVPPRVPAKFDGSGPLFSPVEDATAGKYDEDGSWPATILSQGVGMVLDYLAI